MPHFTVVPVEDKPRAEYDSVEGLSWVDYREPAAAPAPGDSYDTVSSDGERGGGRRCPRSGARHIPEPGTDRQRRGPRAARGAAPWGGAPRERRAGGRRLRWCHGRDAEPGDPGSAAAGVTPRPGRAGQG